MNETSQNMLTPLPRTYYAFDDPLNEKKLRVWVGSIPGFVETDDFLLALQVAGVAPVNEIVFKKCPIRSWGFLTFKTFEEASECIELIHGKKLFSRKFIFKFGSNCTLKNSHNLIIIRVESDFTLEARFANPHEVKENYEPNHKNENHRNHSPNFLSDAHRTSLINSLTEESYEMLQDATKTTLWHVYKDPNGVPYYFNSITGHTQWERPIPPLLAVEASTSSLSDKNRLSAPPGSNLFIFHIPNVWDDTELSMHFTPFGNLVSAKVQRDANGYNSGFGFVTYDNPVSASAAVHLMNGFATHSKFLKVQHKKNDHNHN